MTASTFFVGLEYNCFTNICNNRSKTSALPLVEINSYSQLLFVLVPCLQIFAQKFSSNLDMSTLISQTGILAFLHFQTMHTATAPQSFFRLNVDAQISLLTVLTLLKGWTFFNTLIQTRVCISERLHLTARGSLRTKHLFFQHEQIVQ